MCGIVGLFLKDQSLQTQLGTLLAEMLVTMSDRGPDGAGIAIYGDEGEVSSSAAKDATFNPMRLMRILRILRQMWQQQAWMTAKYRWLSRTRMLC